jgi:hypothetical protein
LHGVDLEEVLVDLHPAASTPGCDVDRCEDAVIASFNALLDLDLVFLPGLHPLDEVGRNALDAVIGAAFCWGPCDVRVEELEHPLDLVALKLRKEPLNHLDVLLRHRPGSISRRGRCGVDRADQRAVKLYEGVTAAIKRGVQAS